jgi:hypothetical protein
MIMQWTVERLRRSASVPMLATALLLAAGSAWARDQDRSPANDSNAGERAETPRAEPQESPSEPPPQAPEPPSASPAEPPPSAEPSTPPSDSGSGDDSSSGSSGHTAIPTGPDDHGHGPNRQPPTQHGGGHGHGSGGGVVDDGYVDGDSVYNPSFPYPGGPYPGGPYQGGPYYGGGHSSREDMGALDLDISPGRAQVYLDGQYIGTVDDFDGWPKYLWLPADTYDLVFYLDGYQTLGREMTVRPALVIDMDDRLQPGRSIRPEDFSLEPGQ